MKITPIYGEKHVDLLVWNAVPPTIEWPWPVSKPWWRIVAEQYRRIRDPR